MFFPRVSIHVQLFSLQDVVIILKDTDVEWGLEDKK